MALKIGIKSQLTGLLLLIIATCFALMMMVVVFSTHSFITSLQQTSLKQYSRDLSAAIDDALANVTAHMELFAYTDLFPDAFTPVADTEDGATKSIEMLNHIVEQYPIIEAVVLVNRNKMGVASNQTASSLRHSNFASLAVLKNMGEQVSTIDATPVMSPTGSRHFVITMSYAIRNANNEMVGALVLFLNLQQVSYTYLATRNYPDGIFAFVANSNGQYVLHSMEGHILAQEPDTTIAHSVKLVASEGGTAIEVGTWGNQYLFSTHKLTHLPWTTFVVSPATTSVYSIQTMILTTILPMVLGFTVITVILFNILLQSRFVNRMMAIKSAMDYAVNGDLTTVTYVKGNDEIAQMAFSFKNLMAGLSNLIHNMNIKMQGFAHNNVELSNCIDDTVLAVGKIDLAMKHAQNEMSNQSRSVDITSRSIGEMATSIEILDKAIRENSSSINTSTQSIQSVISSINTIAKMMTVTNEYANALKNQSKEGEVRLAKAISEINNVAQSSSQLLKANSLVAKVASKTTILAMNAAIEAAHAGDHGSGFAVVADEVRNLAELSTSQSRNIQRIIVDISNLVNVAVDSNNGTQEMITKIFQTVGHLEGLMGDMSKLITEQAADSKGFLRGIDEIREMASTVKHESNNLLIKNGDILKQVDNLVLASGRLEGEIRNTVTQLQEINQVIETIKYIDSKNRNTVGTLLLDSTRFKINEETEEEERVVVEGENLATEGEKKEATPPLPATDEGITLF